MNLVGVKERRSTGVYGILSLRDWKVYVGSASKSIRGRLTKHYNDLRANRHPNIHLQRAWNKYKAGNFVFFKVEVCPSQLARGREQYWMDSLKSANQRYGYNICPMARSSLGSKHPSLIGNQHGKALKGRKHTAERRAIQRIAMVGNTNGKGCKGMKRTEENKRKLRLISLKQWSDPEARRQMSEIKKAQYASDPDLKRRLSEANTGKKQSSETVAKRVSKLIGQRRSSEKCINISNGIRALGKERLSERIRLGWIKRRAKQMNLLGSG